MVRKQVLITADQNRRSKALASAQRVSEGELVREGLQAMLRRSETADEDWKAAWRQAEGIWADRTDIDELMAERRAVRGRRRDRINKLMRGE